MRRPRLRGVAAVGVGIALVVAAWGVMALEPDQEFAQRPIDVRVEVGERGVGRNVIATVHEVVIAEALTHEDEYNPWNGTTTGTWIVVFASVESVISIRSRSPAEIVPAVTMVSSICRNGAQ